MPDYSEPIEMRIDRFVERLAAVKIDNVFNPYSDLCPIHDHSESARIRSNNLRAALTSSIALGVDSIWFGRDLGYRGGRRTGLALTDEGRLPVLARKLGASSIQKATAGAVVTERTATIVWDLIAEIGTVPFMWNAFPLHPHDPDSPMTNRTHTRRDRAQVWALNRELIDILRPRHLVAIGNDAYAALEEEGLQCDYVRHPSYGGKPEFVAGMRKIYCVSKAGLRAESKAEQQLGLLD